MTKLLEQENKTNAVQWSQLKKTVPATSYGQEKEATVDRAQFTKYKGWTHVLMKEIFYVCTNSVHCWSQR